MRMHGMMACDGETVFNVHPQRVLVSGEADLEVLSGHVDPGTVAHTAGEARRWQLTPSGSWIEKEEEQ